MTDPEREDDLYTFKELPLKRPPEAYKQDNTEEKFWRKFQVHENGRALVHVVYRSLKL